MGHKTFTQDYVCQIELQWTKQQFSDELLEMLKNQVISISKVSVPGEQEHQVALVWHIPNEEYFQTTEVNVIARQLLTELVERTEISHYYVNSPDHWVHTWKRDPQKEKAN